MLDLTMTSDNDELLAYTFALSAHVVRRRAGGKTVVHNLKTGKYHRLNPVAGRMLSAVTSAPSARAAAAEIAREYSRDQADVEADLAQLCRDLLDRQLIETSPSLPASD